MTECSRLILSDVAVAVQCTTVVLNSFQVPGGQTLNLDLLDGTTVNMSSYLVACVPRDAGGADSFSTLDGDITFAHQNWEGPLFQVR
jgi:galacturan 1,4-alpha-galacturonidase